MENIKITAGRDILGDFAPDFAHFNDDILFGENWNNEGIDTKLRCILTLTALISSGITDSSLDFHMENAKNNGVSKNEIAQIITHIAFYAGWPKAWAAFNKAIVIWKDDFNDSDDFNDNSKKNTSSDKIDTDSEKSLHQSKMIFPIGDFNSAFSDYFSKKSYLYPISTDQIGIYNVTFEPGCRNNWHIHNAKSGGGQILICIAGEGYYKEWGKDTIIIKPGDVVNIPTGVKHWHGAKDDSWFSHLAIEVPGVDTSTQWLESSEDCDVNA